MRGLAFEIRSNTTKQKINNWRNGGQFQKSRVRNQLVRLSHQFEKNTNKLVIGQMLETQR